MFKIEKNVPMPVTSKIYPFAEMEIGDSFEFPAEKSSSVRAQVTKMKPKKFATRGCRIWRIA